MSAIPPTFRAYVATRGDDAFERGVRSFAEADLPPGEVEVRVAWSSVNYKDGLAARADGKVARISPLIPGHRLGRRGRGVRRPGIRGGCARGRPRVRARGIAPWWLLRIRARAGGLGRATCSRSVATRRDGDRHGRVHRGDVRRRVGGARAGARVGSGPRDGGVRRGRRHGGRDPGRSRLRGVGIDRQAGRGRPPARPWSGRDPGP